VGGRVDGVEREEYIVESGVRELNSGERVRGLNSRERGERTEQMTLLPLLPLLPLRCSPGSALHQCLLEL
jgi:hypothetical protein